MGTRKRHSWPYGALSLAAHGALVGLLLGREVPASQAHPASQARWIVAETVPSEAAETEAPNTPDPVEPSPPPRPRRLSPRPAAASALPQPPAPVQAQPVAPEPSPSVSEPVDFSGLTLTNADGAAWRSAVGSGAALAGPVGPAGARGTPGGRGGPVTHPGPSGPRLVAAGDLSRSPRPPDLDARLRALYPESARHQGLEGDVRVSVTVLPSGRLGALRVQSATDPRFASACLRLLEGSRWTPPLDRTGSPVGTRVAYRCQFLLN